MNIAVLLSGTGRTLENLIRSYIPIKLVISNKENVRGNEIALDNNIPLVVMPNKPELSENVFDLCRANGIGLVCLAGFLKRLTIPKDYENKVMNIHPSLLPSFGGEGMYGMNVHKAVWERGCKITGCTVHFVDNQYDAGPIILQKSIPITYGDNPEAIANKVFIEECYLYPLVIDHFIEKRIKVIGKRVEIES